MFGLSFGEVMIILVVALLVLGPKGLPDVARTIGKGLRDFKRATSDLRSSMEDEFYQLDKAVEGTTTPAPKVQAAAGAVVRADPAVVAQAGMPVAPGPPAAPSAPAAAPAPAPAEVAAAPAPEPAAPAEPEKPAEAVKT